MVFILSIADGLVAVVTFMPAQVLQVPRFGIAYTLLPVTCLLSSFFVVVVVVVVVVNWC